MFRHTYVLLAVVGLWLGLGAQVRAQTPPVAYWVGPPTVEVSEGVGSIAVQIALSGTPLGSQFVIHSVQAGGTATAVDDFTGGAGFLSWAPGDTTAQNIQIVIVDDALVEPTETIFLVISDADGPLISPTDNVLQINIVDNDGPGGLPRATLTDFFGRPGDVSAVYCPDNQGQMFPCGEVMTFRFPWGDPRSIEVNIDPPVASGDTLRIGLESWGAVTLASTELVITNTDEETIPYSVTTGGWAAFGGVRIVAPGVIAPPAAGEFHEARILVDEVVPWGIDFCAACVVWIYMLTDTERPCEHPECHLTVGCGAKSSGRRAAKAVTDLDLLRRYRDEALATSSEGLAVTDLYGAMGGGLVQAFLGNPGLGADFAAARNGWLPALTNLLDGDGAMVISPAMQTQLTTLLDNLAAAAGPELAAQLADLRIAAGLDALTGLTVAAAQAQFTAGGATPIESTSWGNLKAQFR